MDEAELQSVEAFGEFLLDEDRVIFTFEEAELLAGHLKLHVACIIRDLRSYGFTMAQREKAVRVRGFRTSSHDRWYGPGAERTFGGSGQDQILGFAR